MSYQYYSVLQNINTVDFDELNNLTSDKVSLSLEDQSLNKMIPTTNFIEITLLSRTINLDTLISHNLCHQDFVFPHTTLICELDLSSSDTVNNILTRLLIIQFWCCVSDSQILSNSRIISLIQKKISIHVNNGMSMRYTSVRTILCHVLDSKEILNSQLKVKSQLLNSANSFYCLLLNIIIVAPPLNTSVLISKMTLMEGITILSEIIQFNIQNLMFNVNVIQLLQQNLIQSQNKLWLLIDEYNSLEITVILVLLIRDGIVRLFINLLNWIGMNL